jgi:hypothetical protein
MVVLRRLRDAGFGLAVGGAGLVIVARLGLHPGDASSAVMSARRELVLVAGLVLMVTGVAVVPLERASGVLTRFEPPGWLAGTVLAGCAAFLAWALFGALNQSLWHDEAYSVLYYTSGGPSDILFGDYVPNDHVLFNLLAWLTTNVVGESEVAYRVWSVVPAFAASVAIVWWAWVRLGRAVGVAAGLLGATSPMVLLLVRDARGYGLGLLAAAVALISADRFARDRSTRVLLGFGAAGFVGIATLPVFAIAFVGQALPLLSRRDLRVRAALTVGIVGLLSLLFYAPLLGGILDSAGQQFGRRLPWHGPLSAAMTDLLGPNVQIAFGSGAPPELPDSSLRPDNAIAAGLSAVGLLMLLRSGARMVGALVAVPVLFFYTVLTVARFFVAPRFGSFLLFHVILLAAVGIVGLIALLPATLPRAVGVAAGVAAAAFVVLHAARLTDAVHDLPRENFKDVAQIARSAGSGPILTDSVRPTGLQYYLGFDGISVLPPEALQDRFCSGGGPYTYIEHPFRGAGDPPTPDLSCLRQRHARVTRIRQRDRGGHIDVWVVPAR